MSGKAPKRCSLAGHLYIEATDTSIAEHLSPTWKQGGQETAAEFMRRVAGRLNEFADAVDPRHQEPTP